MTKYFPRPSAASLMLALFGEKEKLAEASVVVLYAVNGQCFGTKNNFCTRGTYGIIIAFSKPGCRPARERGKGPGNSSTFTGAGYNKGALE